ncbi:hypothetical protein [Paraflavitalea sp. CAU 1676]|uniref:hypothetical protein n=1 Tax=Paraflavitalea sp. CAU 1676 TaxID=3032598 RepID=UPI0023DA1EC6|nr:hypothetical protein [Paraflavitalea sp. CAU 1676]MDF2193423.1 hypothetical protein [Paraflavitalea sp. CAU 1676]
MRSPIHTSLLLFAVFLLSCKLQAQERDLATLEALDSTFSLYTSRQPSDLFLHTDKNVYVHGENIWFSAYVMGYDTTAPQHTLYTVLVEEATQKIAATERFVLDNGLGGGTLFLPDSLPLGEYRLLAYTNQYLNHTRQPVFQQSISLRGSEPNTFKLSILPAAANAASSDSAFFMVKVLTEYGGLASGGTVAYSLLADGKPLQSGNQKINAFGELSLGVAKAAVRGKRLQLLATVTRDKQKQVIRTAIPLLLDEAIIKLYPEGGNLVHLQPTSMALEIRNGAGTPLALRGQLLANGKVVAAFQTSRYGTAVIDWIPQLGNNYTIRLDDATHQPVYQVPPIAPEGYSLHLRDGVTGDSTLLVEMGTPGPGACHLVAHNYRQSFFSGTFRTTKERAALRIPTNDMPEGVVTLTFFDSTGTPRAERAVYIRRRQPLQVQLTTDSALYHHRSKLQLTVKVTNQQGQPVTGIFSLACVLASRIDTTRAYDIGRYLTFDRFLPAPATLPAADYFTNDQNIQELLLTRYWTRYKWEEIQNSPPVVQQEEKICDMGVVTYRERPVRKPVSLMIITGKQTYTLATDSAGHFELPAQALATEPGKKVIILVSDVKDFKDYRVTMRNPCSILDTGLSHQHWPPADFIRAELSVQEQDHLKKALQAVVVTAKKENHYGGSVFKSANCNDWVCMYNVLNCQNHPTGSQPVDGQLYNYRGMQVVYEGCKDDTPPGFLQQVQGVSYPKEFYVADYEKFNPTEPELMSTVYWNYQVVTNQQGEATLQFSTNDLNGRFVAVLQGITGQGAISGKTWFKVIPPSDAPAAQAPQ